MPFRNIKPSVSGSELSSEIALDIDVVLGVGTFGCLLCSALKVAFQSHFDKEPKLVGLWIDFERKSQIRNVGLNFLAGFPMLIGFSGNNIIGAWEGIDVSPHPKSIAEQLRDVILEYRGLLENYANEL
jgi:hypothetical protein